MGDRFNTKVNTDPKTISLQREEFLSFNVNEEVQSQNIEYKCSRQIRHKSIKIY